MARESSFQTKLVQTLRGLFPGSIILKNDPNYLQGVPDLLILFGERWAALECKAHGAAGEQPNQDYYVDMMDAMSFAAFVHPGNQDEVLRELQRAFRSRGATRVSERQQLSLGKLRRREAGSSVAQRAGSQERH